MPVDAKLARDTHVADETFTLDRLLDKVGLARKLRLVMLDSCRNNPFVAGMARTTATRSIGRGLARIEPEDAWRCLLTFEKRDLARMALDGSGAHSPFAGALLGYCEEPGLELQFLFRKVRDQVIATTNQAQEPFLYGSLSSERFFFRP